MEIRGEGGSLEFDLRGGVAHVTRIDLARDGGEEAAYDLLREAVERVREQGVTHLAIEVAEGDEQSAARYSRFGFVPVAKTLGVDLDVFESVLDRQPRGESFGSVHVQLDDQPAVERGVRRFVPLLAGRSQVRRHRRAAAGWGVRRALRPGTGGAPPTGA